MVLSKIQSAITDYAVWLAETRHHPHIHLWESQQIFQNEWNLEISDLPKMYDNSLQNPETKRLWQTESWYPKRMLLEFWKIDASMVKTMFDDLFNETKEIEPRIGRFIFGCDVLLKEYKSSKPATVENNHYHTDFKMIALYLAFRYPDVYAPYDFDVFKRTLEHFQAKDIPQGNDIGRYFKVQRTLMTFLEKNEKVAAGLAKHLHPKRHYNGKSLLVAADFCRFVANSR
jgi:hypothetical protein